MPLERAPYTDVKRDGVKVGEELAFEVPRRPYWHNPDVEWTDGMDWRPNTPFQASLKVLGAYNKGFHLLDEETNTRYPMFVSDMADAIITGAVSGGYATGTWIVVKKNVVYGIKLAK